MERQKSQARQYVSRTSACTTKDRPVAFDVGGTKTTNITKLTSVSSVYTVGKMSILWEIRLL